MVHILAGCVVASCLWSSLGRGLRRMEGKVRMRTCESYTPVVPQHPQLLLLQQQSRIGNCLGTVVSTAASPVDEERGGLKEKVVEKEVRNGRAGKHEWRRDDLKAQCVCPQKETERRNFQALLEGGSCCAGRRGEVKGLK